MGIENELQQVEVGGRLPLEERVEQVFLRIEARRNAMTNHEELPLDAAAKAAVNQGMMWLMLSVVEECEADRPQVMAWLAASDSEQASLARQAEVEIEKSKLEAWIDFSFDALYDRMGDRGIEQPDPSSEYEQEREDALWFADYSVIKAMHDRAVCGRLKREADLAWKNQREVLSSIHAIA